MISQDSTLVQQDTTLVKVDSLPPPKDNLKNFEVVFIVSAPPHSIETKKEDVRDENLVFDLPLASFIVLCIFLFDRFVGYLGGRRAGRRTWYMDVIIKPNQSKVDDLFDEITNKIISTNNKLKRNKAKKQADRIKIVSKATNEIGQEIQKFVFEVIYLIRAQDPDLEDKLFNKIMEAIDVFSIGFDSANADLVDLEEMNSQILNKKVQFYSIMYDSIRWKSLPRSTFDEAKSFFSSLKRNFRNSNFSQRLNKLGERFRSEKA